MGLEGRVFLPLSGDLSRSQRQEVSDEHVEVLFPVAFEAAFDGPQVVGVEPFLAIALERHQDEVGDHVGAGEVPAAGVHGLEDPVRVVFALLELESDDAELAQARAERRDVRAELLDAFLEERQRIGDARRRLVRQGAVVDQRQQGLRIPRLEHQAVALVALAEGIDEILAPDLVGLEAVRRCVVFEVAGERLEDEGDRGQALLSVIDHEGRPVGVEGIDGGDVHDGSEEVLAHVLALAGVEDVVPELAAMAPGPGVSALVDGDAELGRVPDEVEEEGFRGAHGFLRIGGTRPGPTPGYPGPHPTQRSTRLLAVREHRFGASALPGGRTDLRWDRARHARCPEQCNEYTRLQLGALIGTVRRHECRNDLRFVSWRLPILGPDRCWRHGRGAPRRIRRCLSRPATAGAGGMRMV